MQQLKKDPNRTARTVDHLSGVVIKSLCFWLAAEQRHIQGRKTCSQPCSAFSLLLQVHSRRSLHVLHLSIPYMHILFAPNSLLLCSKTSAITATSLPWSLLSFHHPAFSLQTFIIQDVAEECRQLRKLAAHVAQNFNAMFSIRTWIFCAIVGVIWFFFVNIKQHWHCSKDEHTEEKPLCLQNDWKKSKVLHSKDNKMTHLPPTEAAIT